MVNYLADFLGKLQPYCGSLIRVKAIKSIEPKAKEYLNKLSKQNLIERITWGWYWVPTDEIVVDVWDFLEKDQNFKVISAQTAASFWNNDFVHRDIYTLMVKDRSYGSALQEFAKKRGWQIELEYLKDSSKVKYRKVGNLLVETIEDNVVGCLQRWAFVDAFATLYEHRDKIDWDRLYQNAYWKRISKTNVRAKQVLEYGFCQFEELGSGVKFPCRETQVRDDFVRREVDEAVERVVEFG
ncbi:MAG: hypothetical protein FWG55_05945 [Candidatus Bathyarchaeota archaeon]|jgi:hypothetical protein|nr:hypothetical protein [Candidatus Termiticorpusculum sp.]